MIALIALPTLVIYVAALGLTMRQLIRDNRAETEREMTILAEQYAGRFDGALREAAAIANTTADSITARPDITEAEIYAILENTLARYPFVYGSAMGFEPGTIDAPTRLYCPYVHREGDGLARLNLSEDVYDWRDGQEYTWFRAPRDTGRGVWTDPYFDEDAGNVLMVTYSAPFYRDGMFRGVATIDIEIARLNETIGRSIVGQNRFYVLTTNGTFIYHSNPDAIGDNIFARSERAGREDIADLGHRITSGQSGTAILDAIAGVDSDSGPVWIFYAPIESTGWGFASLVSEDVALAGVRKRLTFAAAALGGTLVFILGAIWIVSGRIARPITRLSERVGAISAGDLDAHIDCATGGDEICDLADAFNTMTDNLRGMIARVAHEESQRRDAVIFSMAKLTESRDTDTGQHLERICRYTEIIALELAKTHDQINQTWIETVRVTAALHDIGKVGIPDAVLQKPGKLTDEEHDIIKTHTTIGGDTLLALWRRWGDDTFLETATQIALAHHERWDGDGYPYGLKGEEIAMAARIVAVADVYDALTSKRVYKPAMPHEKACSIIQEGAGGHFDPVVVDAFMRVNEQIETASRELRN